MTPALLQACLSVLSWSQDDLARHIDCSADLVRDWADGSGDHAVPTAIADWLEGLAGMIAGSRGVEEWLAWRDSLPAYYLPPERWQSPREQAFGHYCEPAKR